MPRGYLPVLPPDEDDNRGPAGGMLPRQLGKPARGQAPLPNRNVILAPQSRVPSSGAYGKTPPKRKK